MDKKKKSLAYPLIYMFVLTTILIGILALLNEFTQPAIAFNEELELKEKILKVFDLYDENLSDQDMDALFNERIKEESMTNQNGREVIYYILEEGSQIQAYALPFEGPGLWGNIIGYFGVDKDFESATGIEFIKQDETPGLGGRIAEEPYKSQYRGLSLTESEEGEYIINRPAPGGNIDAIAGATQTSQFVTQMVNKDIKYFMDQVSK